MQSHNAFIHVVKTLLNFTNGSPFLIQMNLPHIPRYVLYARAHVELKPLLTVFKYCLEVYCLCI